jgi:hypothetical protein
MKCKSDQIGMVGDYCAKSTHRGTNDTLKKKKQS